MDGAYSPRPAICQDQSRSMAMDGDRYSPACDAVLTDGAYVCDAIRPSIMIVMIGLFLGLILGANVHAKR